MTEKPTFDEWVEDTPIPLKGHPGYDLRDYLPKNYKWTQGRAQNLQSYYMSSMQHNAINEARQVMRDAERSARPVEHERNYEKLQPWEKSVLAFLPSAAASFGAWWNDQPDSIKKAGAATGSFLAPIMAPIGKFIGAAGTVLDVGAEGVERIAGMADQYAYAKASGTLDEYFKNLDDAWKASTFYYEITGSQKPMVEQTPTGMRFMGLFGGTPASPDQTPVMSVADLAYARQRFSQGADWSTVQGELEQKGGALWMRGQMWDMLGHVILDPSWLIFPYLKPVERAIKGIKTLETLVPEVAVRGFDDALRAVERAMELTAAGEKALPDELIPALKGAEGFGDEAVALARQALKDGPGSEAAAKLRTLWEKGYEELGQAIPKMVRENSWEEKARNILTKLDIGPQRADAAGKMIERKGVPGLKWFGLTPQSRSLELMEMVSTHVQTILSDARDLPTIQGRMAAAIRAVSSAPLEPKLVSHEVRTLRAALGQSGVAWDDIFKAYSQSAGERQLLNNLAELLGRNPKAHGLDDILRMIQKDPQNVLNRAGEIIQSGRVPKSQGAMAVAKAIAEGQIDAKTVKSLATLFFDRKVPFDIASLKLHLQGATYDAVARQMVLQLGEQSRGLWMKAADVLKASETLAYLKLNPGYPIRNFLNNEMTMAFRGVWGRWGQGKDVERFWNRVGFVPERLKEGFGPADLAAEAKKASGLAHEALLEAEKAAKIAVKGADSDTGILGMVTRRISDINLGKLDMAKLGQQAEMSASQRALTAGYMKYWRGMWKGGSGYDTVNTFLTRRFPGLDISSLGDDVERTLERAVRGSVGPSDIDDVFFKNLNAGFDTILDNTAEKLGLRADDLKKVLPDEYMEVLRKDLGDALQTGDPERIASTLDNAVQVVGQHLDDIAKTAIKLRAERAITVLETEGPGAYMTFWREMTADWNDAMFGHLKTMEDQMPFIRGIEDMSARAGAYSRLASQEAEMFRRASMIQREGIQNLRAGIQKLAQEKGLRLPADPMREFDAMQADMDGFFSFIRRERNKFFRNKALHPADGMSDVERMAVEAKREQIWLKMSDRFDTEYGKLVDSMYNHGLAIDDYLSIGASRSAQEMAHVRAGRYTVHELQREYQRNQQSFSRQYAALPRHTPIEQRAAKQQEMAAIRMRYRNLIHMAEREAQDAMAAKTPWGNVHILSGEVSDPTDVEILLEAYRRALGNVGPRQQAEQAARKAAKETAAAAGEVVEEVPREIGSMAAMNASMRLNMIPEEVGMDPLNAVWMQGGHTIMEAMRQASLDALKKPVLKLDDVLRGLPEEEALRWRSALAGYAEHLHTKMPEVQRMSLKMGEALRDSALLNYSRRTYVDNAMAMFMPFGFWTTHSVWNWALWSMNRPAGLHTWFKVKEYLESAGQRNVPTRLRGSMPVPFLDIPGVPDWMGTIYASPSRIGWPMDGWLDPLANTYNAGMSNINRAGSLIEKWKANGTITEAEYSEAKRQSGPLWEQALSQSQEQDGYDTLDTLSMLLAPHAPLQWAWKAARGKTDEIGPFLPLTRTVKGITALLGVPGGVNIEGWAREKLGLPRFDKWEDYRVDRMISNLVSDGIITVDEGQRAMIDRKGEAYDLAVMGAGKEFGISALGSMLGVPLKAYPDGEEKARVNTQMLYDAYAKEEETGITGIVNKVFDEHPDIAVRMALFDKPEDRMKSFLVDNLWARWNSMPQLSKDALREALGPEFDQNFLQKDSSGRRSYAVSPQTLGVWLRLMGGDPPGTLDLSAEKVPDVASPPPQIAQKAELYYEQRDRQFGDAIWELQSTYFQLAEGSDARRAFLSQNPELKRYWNWRYDWLMRNPDVMPYLVENPDDPKYKYSSLKQLQYVQQNTPNMRWSDWVDHFGEPSSRLMVDYFTDAGGLPETIRRTLEKEAALYGVTYEQLLENLQSSYVQSGRP
jgi:hypothetical protein